MSTTLKDKLEKIKGAFDVLAAKFNAAEPTPTPTPEPITAKMATEYKTSDGQTVLSISELVVGGDVMIGETAAPDGTHTLEDGTVIVTVGGKITEVKSVEPISTEIPEEMKKMQDTITKMSSQIAALETALTTQKQNFSASIANNKDLMELVVELSEKSIVAPVEKVVDYSKLTPLQKFRLSKQN
jgi:di/tripeptidase